MEQKREREKGEIPGAESARLGSKLSRRLGRLSRVKIECPAKNSISQRQKHQKQTKEGENKRTNFQPSLTTITAKIKAQPLSELL
jgi:hypothetical protein